MEYYIVKKLIVLPRSIICDCVEGLCICEISPVMILQKRKIVSSKLPKHLQHIVKLSVVDSIKASFVSVLLKKCMLLPCGDEKSFFYAIALANAMETDWADFFYKIQ